MLETARNDIDIWLVDYRQVEDSTLLEQYAQLLTVEEAARHERLIFTQHRLQFLVARALVRDVLAQYLDIEDPASLEFGTNKHGKPELLIETTVQFNLSHTNGLIALAVMQVDPVGIDVEYLSRQADIKNLTERYFSRDEAEALLALPVDQWNNRFYDLWTLKEAYLKACGTGIRTPLQEFSFIFPDESGINVSFSPLLQDDPASWKFWQLETEGGFRLSLAVNDKSGIDYRLRIKQGIPLATYSEISPRLVRSTSI